MLIQATPTEKQIIFLMTVCINHHPSASFPPGASLLRVRRRPPVASGAHYTHKDTLLSRCAINTPSNLWSGLQRYLTTVIWVALSSVVGCWTIPVDHSDSGSEEPENRSATSDPVGPPTSTRGGVWITLFDWIESIVATSGASQRRLDKCSGRRGPT